MRLIDAQAVINLIADIQYDDRYINNNEVFVALETVRDCVFNLPTTYDVDSVIEEMEANEEFFRDMDDDFYYEGMHHAFIDAIDIVKRGGNDKRRS